MLEHREQTAYFLSVAKEVLSQFEFQVYRRWMIGYKTSEIASELGVSAKAVDNAKNRMWSKLRRRLFPENN
jgi:DNA-binding CsgD family transcriptional regulator